MIQQKEMEKQYYTYILASKKNGKLYVGITSDLIKRVYEHREGLVDGYTKINNIKHLVYFEIFGDVELAIQREKRLKKYNRQWKINLIEDQNPDWNDLWNKIIE